MLNNNFKLIKMFTFILVAFMVSQFTLSSVLAATPPPGLTCYIGYDTPSLSPTYAVEPGLDIQNNGGNAGWHGIDLYGGQTGFYGALISTPDAWSCYLGDDWTLTLDPAEGTVEMWISPNWNGSNQSGSGIGSTGATQILWIIGAPSINLGGQGVHIAIFNCGFPNSGGELFGFWRASDDIYRDLQASPQQPGNNSTIYGLTDNWVAGQWHHVAFCWDATTLGLYLDGKVVDQTDRPSLAHPFEAGWWVGGDTNNNTNGLSTWDGKIDDLAIWNVARYTADYTPPTTPIIPRDSNDSLARTPRPSDGETGVDRRTDLSWLAGYRAGSHDVYFGTNYDDVNDANNSDPSGPSYVYRGNQDPCNYTIPEIPLALNTTYFWRVDEVGDDAPKGKVWSFTTSEQNLPAGFLVLGNTVPLEYDPPVIPPGYTEQPPVTNTIPLTTTQEEDARGYLTYIKSYLDPIYPITIPTRPQVTNQLSMFSIPGEYEPITFTIYAINNMTNVLVSVSDLTGPTGTIGADNIEIRSVRCWPRKVWGEQKYIISPSFLEKRTTLDVNNNTSQRYWLTVYVPADTKAGTYTATLSISVSNLDDYALDLELEVQDFQLMTSPTIHGMYYNPTYQIPSIWLEPLPAERLRKDVKNMQEHGIKTTYVPYPPYCASYINATGEIVFNFDLMHPFGEACQRAGFLPMIYNIMISEIIDSPLGNWTTMLTAYADSLVDRGWPTVMPSVTDEADADPERTASAQSRMAAIKSNIPDMQTFQSIVWPENSELFEPHCDIRAFSSYVDQTVIAPTRAAGRQLWQYSGVASYGLAPKADRFYHGIWACKLTLDGLTDWTYYHPVLDAEQPYQDLFPGATRNNMTAWVWPTDDGPLPSPGWEGIREGIEDEKYIYTLTTLIELVRQTGYDYPETLAEAAELYLNSLYAQIDASPRADDSVFPVSRENAKLTSSFYNFRAECANHIQALNKSLGDINGDFIIDYKDLSLMAADWATLYDFEDLAILTANFGNNNYPSEP